MQSECSSVCTDEPVSMDKKCVPTATQRSDPWPRSSCRPSIHRWRRRRRCLPAGDRDLQGARVARVTGRGSTHAQGADVLAPPLARRASRRQRSNWAPTRSKSLQRPDLSARRALSCVSYSARLVGRWGVETDLDVSDLVDVGTIGGIETPSAVVCNYLSSTAAADALAPRSRQILVLHDVPPRRLSTRVAQRFAGRPHIVTLTREDAQRLKTSTGASCEVGVPFEKRRTLTFDDILKYHRLGDLVDASGPAQRPQHGWARSPAALGSSLDLLFVGGTHRPNVEGLAAFVEECFLPHLASSGVGSSWQVRLARHFGEGDSRRAASWRSAVLRICGRSMQRLSSSLCRS